MRLSPSAMLFGTTGVGMSVTDGVILIDDNPAVSPNGLDPAWRGLSIPELKLYVPRGVPLAGGTTVTASLSLTSPAGVDATATVRLPAADGRPELTAVVQWRDPAATRLGDLLPTLIEIVALLPVDGMKVPAVGEELTIGGGAPTRLRVRYARDPRQSPVVVGFTAALEADGDQGLITVRADPQSSAAPKAVITAAALATAVMADAPKPPPRLGDDGSGALLHDLLVAALGLSAVLTQQGRVVVHGVTIGYGAAPWHLLLLLVYLPGILGLGGETYTAASGLTPQPLLARWLAVSAAIFAVSAMLHVLRRRRRRDAGRSVTRR
ncbi:hypothetical protein ACIBCR_19305 [Micromonospora echinospora]|uniref:hypothetical protein n=1 Tax=Micromonospora echinospora TaxID=1877 RepID=UPI0037A9F760